MRVIKEGRKPVKEIEKTCDQCGCVFAYERGDVHCIDQREGCFVYCPTCEKALSVGYFPNY